jgi:hypothetical protein
MNCFSYLVWIGVSLNIHGYTSNIHGLATTAASTAN